MTLPHYQIRPLNGGGWTGPSTVGRWSHYRFRAAWGDTLDLLLHEAGLLGADLVVIQVDITEADLRRDGMVRAHAQLRHPGVRVSFDSVHGPLTYATDAYDRWQANVRAIALALQALRAVDRYGVTRSGEQYRGWTAIAATAAETTLTPDEAARVLADAAGVSASTLLRSADAIAAAGDVHTVTVTQSRQLIQAAFRAAARTAHPDAGGNADVFRLIRRARDVLLGWSGGG
ncbi:molecular chaperone DnaJ [Micromonospora thermarum]|uniref:Molecular chaperone DnaJ n=1 Tax=Micromonospora thermarum TaxID=2720024 RepID=A0ABX0ZCW5_9ACTN|nr:molecular chaperone DnaJ [Micromonospora thermarum]NJP33710.1 molecular chaperone DnaJ [Micromonospora thermarum]